MSRYDQHILKALEKRRDDPVAQTQFAVSAIHHIAAVDNMAYLEQSTCAKLLEALERHPDFYRYFYIYEIRNKHLPKEKKYPRTTLDDYAEACNKFFPFLETGYSSTFKNGILKALATNLSTSKFEGDWSQTSLQKKIDHLNQMALSFLDYYDPENIIHKNSYFDQECVVEIDYSLVAEKNLFNSTAHHDFERGTIRYYNYVTKFFSNDYIEKHKPECEIDFDATSKLEEEDIFPFFNLTQDKSKGNFHVQTSAHDPDMEFRSNLATEVESLATLAHELLHLCAFRLYLCFTDEPERIERLFGFNKTDHQIHSVSICGYTNSDKDFNAYMQNKEEIAAREAGSHIESLLLLSRQTTSPRFGDWNYSPEIV